MKRYDKNISWIFFILFLWFLIYWIVNIAINESKKPDTCAPTQDHQVI